MKDAVKRLPDEDRRCTIDGCPEIAEYDPVTDLWECPSHGDVIFFLGGGEGEKEGEGVK